ncbi:hypothetical protein ACIGO7_35550 [Streptomyces virginiae]|uniref:hypothetical protein n=1 Tax=Streptomyces virginiae TaxID=1961 RepID=UPI00344B66FC
MNQPSTWVITRANIAEIDDAVDRDGIYAKGYFEDVDGRIACVGLRIGSGGTRQVARYGDTVTRSDNGTWTVTPAAEADQ